MSNVKAAAQNAQQIKFESGKALKVLTEAFEKVQHTQAAFWRGLTKKEEMADTADAYFYFLMSPLKLEAKNKSGIRLGRLAAIVTKQKAEGEIDWPAAMEYVKKQGSAPKMLPKAITSMGDLLTKKELEGFFEWATESTSTEVQRSIMDFEPKMWREKLEDGTYKLTDPIAKASLIIKVDNPDHELFANRTIDQFNQEGVGVWADLECEKIG